MPAFVGLGAPYWDADARGAIFGLTRNSGAAEIARAALEAVGYQTRDLLEAMRADWPGAGDTVLRVDGGMTASDPAMQFLADILGAPVDRPVVMETTALGAAYLAGLQAGVCPEPSGFQATWRLDRRFEPAMEAGDARAANGRAGRRRWRGCARPISVAAMADAPLASGCRSEVSAAGAVRGGQQALWRLRRRRAGDARYFRA